MGCLAVGVTAGVRGDRLDACGEEAILQLAEAGDAPSKFAPELSASIQDHLGGWAWRYHDAVRQGAGVGVEFAVFCGYGEAGGR